MNYYLKRCHNAFKDNSWPEIDSYYDFTQLPNSIQQECIDNSVFSERITQIENIDYWRNHCVQGVYKKNNLVFVSMYKCASSSYIVYLQKQQWQKIEFNEINFNTMYVFGFILDPLVRRIKGLTEILWHCYNNNYNDVMQIVKNDNFCSFLKNISSMDAHTIPYWILFGDQLKKINWIPLEFYTHNETFNCFQQICKQHNVHLDSSIKLKKHNVSSKDKKKLFVLIKQILQDQCFGDLYLLYSNDLKFYRELIDKHKIQEAIENSNTDCQRRS